MYTFIIRKYDNIYEDYNINVHTNKHKDVTKETYY